MRIYENPEKTSMNRLPPRSYYIPGGCSRHYDLNGTWNFAFFSRDIDVPETIGKISLSVPKGNIYLSPCTSYRYRCLGVFPTQNPMRTFLA
mgnify:CR=1 FL=1